MLNFKLKKIIINQILCNKNLKLQVHDASTIIICMTWIYFSRGKNNHQVAWGGLDSSLQLYFSYTLP